MRNVSRGLAHHLVTGKSSPLLEQSSAGGARRMPMIRQWYGRVKFLEPIVNVWETTAGKARANILRQASEAGYNVRLPDVQVRLGPAPAYWFEIERKANALRR